MTLPVRKKIEKQIVIASESVAIHRGLLAGLPSHFALAMTQNPNISVISKSSTFSTLLPPSTTATKKRSKSDIFTFYQ
jgi:hypothetical protein